eukprot:NODE_20_length_39102_cov_0.325513.p9 type:complete len:312 gc:universal NODE_20_length_39102_cov_0.325513:8731-9666(+)
MAYFKHMGLGYSKSKNTENEIQKTDIFKEKTEDSDMYYGPIVYTPSMDERRNPKLFEVLAEESINYKMGSKHVDDKMFELIETHSSKGREQTNYCSAIIDLLLDINLSSDLKVQKVGDKFLLSGIYTCTLPEMSLNLYINEDPGRKKSIKPVKSVVLHSLNGKCKFEDLEVSILQFDEKLEVFLFIEGICDAINPKSSFTSSTQISAMLLNIDKGSCATLYQKIYMGDLDLYINDIYGVENYVEGENDDCVICMAAPNNSIVLPCKHLCTCTDCGSLLATQKQKCPICRETIYSIISIRNGIFSADYRPVT